MSGARRGGDAGESLLELLIAIMIIGIGVTAILAAVLMTVDASSLDRRQIDAQALLRSWGEYAVAQTTDATYTPCATTATYDPAGAPSAWSYTSPAPPPGLGALPGGFTPHVTKVEYWNAATKTFVAACGVDSGVQRVALTMTVAASVMPGFSSTYAVVVRRPCLTLGVGGC